MTNAEAPQDTDDNAAEPDAQDVGPAANELKNLLAERDKFRDAALRARADFENYQKRVARDLESERKFAAQPLIVDLLPIIDNLQRALDSAGADGGSIVAGVQLVQKSLLAALEKHGIKPIIPGDEPFDPNQHEAVMQQPVANKPPMTVVQTVRSGYRLHDRVIRPAQVIVSSAP